MKKTFVDSGYCIRRPYGAWPYGTVALWPCGLNAHILAFILWSAARARDHRVHQSSLLLSSLSAM